MLCSTSTCSPQMLIISISGMHMVWMNNEVTKCQCLSGATGGKVLCELQLDPSFAFRLESGKTLRGEDNAGRDATAKMRIEIKQASPLDEVTRKGVIRVDDTTVSNLSDSPPLGVFYEMKSDQFLALVDNIRKGVLPTHVRLSFEAYFNFSPHRGRENPIAIHHFDRVKEFTWKNVSISNECVVDDLAITYGG